MTPPPVAVGLFLCDLVIVDQRTQSPSPINIFTGLAVDDFPSAPQRLSVFAILTNGRGNGRLTLSASRLDTGESIYQQDFPISFTDPLLLVHVNVRVRTIVFPDPGIYQFSLLVDDDPIADRRLRVYQQ